MRLRGCPVCKSEDPDMWEACNHPGCRDGRPGYLGQPRSESFVESVDVISEYELGVRDGIQRREKIAFDVMEFTARVERRNIDLDIENKWLKFQKRLWMFVSFCLLTALLVAVGR